MKKESSAPEHNFDCHKNVVRKVTYANLIKMKIITSVCENAKQQRIKYEIVIGKRWSSSWSGFYTTKLKHNGYWRERNAGKTYTMNGNNRKSLCLIQFIGQKWKEEWIKMMNSSKICSLAISRNILLLFTKSSQTAVHFCFTKLSALHQSNRIKGRRKNFVQLCSGHSGYCGLQNAFSAKSHHQMKCQVHNVCAVLLSVYINEQTLKGAFNVASYKLYTDLMQTSQYSKRWLP